MFNILVTLLKLTFFFINFLFLTQYCAIILSNTNSDESERTAMWYLQELSIPFLGVLCTIIGFVAIVKESRLLLGIYIFTLCAVMGFMSFVFTDILHGDKKYQYFKISLTVTSMYIIFLFIKCIILLMIMIGNNN